MDLLVLKNGLWEKLKPYRPVLIVILTGILLMALPGRSRPSDPAQPPDPNPGQCKADLEASLSELLSGVEGAGSVQVLLSEAVGEQVLYQFDEQRREGEKQRKTVLVSNGNRGEEGLICRVTAPVYQGAVVLCQGGNRPEVRLSMVKAVTNATGLTSDKVTVLKMK